MDRSSWGDAIRRRREALKLTQQQLADAASVSLKTISNIENESLTPQRATLRKVRDALGLSSDLAVASAQASEPKGLERILGFAPEPRYSTGGLDDYLASLEDRISNLEEIVAELEESHLVSDRPDTPELAVAALEGDEDAGEPEDH